MTQNNIPKTMRAAVIEQFGGVEQIKIKEVPVPKSGADEVLIRIEAAGVDVWDVLERQGGFAQMFNIPAKFPYIIGTDCAGTIAATGENVTEFKEGERVYASILLNPKGGFYAEYGAVNAENVGRAPQKLSVEELAVMPSDAMTGLQGLADMLKMKAGETVMIFGASGGIGHLAVQLAKRLGARVFAVASSDDGVALAKNFGADAVVNGRKEDDLGLCVGFHFRITPIHGLLAKPSRLLPSSLRPLPPALRLACSRRAILQRMRRSPREIFGTPQSA